MLTPLRRISLPSETVLSRQVPTTFSPSTGLSSVQNMVDHLVTHGVSEATQGSTLLAMLGAGWAFRVTRTGALSLGTFAEGKPFLPTFVRGGSYALALGSESATFVGIQRGFASWNGKGATQSFQKDWAQAALTFSSLKLFSGLSSAQNLIFQHFTTDLAMVGAHQFGAKAGVIDVPEGSIAEQMVQAEALNWSMKGGMELLHGLFPGVISAERSWDLRLKAQEKGLSSQRKILTPLFFPNSAVASAEGVSPSLSWGEGEVLKGMRPLLMSTKGGNDGEGENDEPTLVSSFESVESSIPVPGQIIDGRYRVEAIIGQGAMGVVYRCRHLALETPVAMKVLIADLSKDPSLTERFLNEAQAASSIKNPHIIHVGDFGNLPDGSTYFIMEFLEGSALTDLMEGEAPVLPDRIVPIARQLAVGLSAAHRAGIIHRDLKPDNIFLTKQEKEKDFVKILDFGIAKISGSGRNKLTRQGMVFGTPQYMSPEQALGQTVDARSDIYSFGVILYEMATGKVPFMAEEAQGIMVQHVGVPPIPLEDMVGRPLHLPRGFEAIVMKCLSKAPEDRYQSMEELITDLDKLTMGELPRAVIDMAERTALVQRVEAPQTTDKMIKPARTNWPLYGGLAGSGVVIAVLSALLLLKKSEKPQLVQASPDAALPPPPPPPDAAILPPPTLKKKQVVLMITPADAHVFRGDQDLGASPLKIDINEGSSIDVEIRREGYKTKKLTLDYSQERPTVKLEKAPKIKNPRTNPNSNPNSNPNDKPPHNPNDLETPFKKKEKPAKP